MIRSLTSDNEPLDCAEVVTPQEAASAARLHYVSDAIPGITRRKSGTGFSYRAIDGSVIKNAETLDRIHKLAIPPAYEHVWISPDPKGHLQATGIDARRRKQYRYHEAFREVREESKFQRMLGFGKALPAIRELVSRDMARQGLPREKVLAVVVYLLEHSLIRVGNSEYAKANKSYGLTTMLTRHVHVEGSSIQFTFLGKSKIKHQIELHDRRLARVVAKIQELPGQELFHYLDEDGRAHSITSSDVNAYIHEIAGQPFTAKDFRTWWASLLALGEFAAREIPATATAAKRAVSQVMRAVSSQLRNTPAICRKCYVHPRIVEAFSEGTLPRLNSRGSELEVMEKALLVLLKGCE